MKKYPLSFLASVLVVMVALVACRSTTSTGPLTRFEFKEPHMGTLFSITMYAPDASTATAAAEAAFRQIGRLDRMMTDYDPKSELMQLCLRPVGEPTKVSPELFEILQESQRVSRETHGAYDVTVGPFVRAWRTARKSRILPTELELAEMRKSVGYEKLRLNARTQSVTLLAAHMQLDLGGIAKGFAADQALAVMRKRGITRALVAASGDIAIGDAPPDRPGWKIGIETLDGAPNEFARSVLLHNAGVSTSGDTEQNVEINGIRYSHIIDPATGLGMTNHVQATVIGPSATVSDGLDTPTAILGVERGLAMIDSQSKVAAILITRDAKGRHFFASHQFKKRFGSN